MKTIPGGLSLDDRGRLIFINEFDPTAEGIHRFYVVENHRAGFIRAWHAHKYEAKFVTALRGTALIGIVPVADLNDPNPMSDPETVILSADKPQVVYIPPKHANGAKTLTDGCILQ